MVKKSVEDRVEQLRLASQSHVDQLQIELAPFLADKWVRFEEKKKKYIQYGIKTRINVNDKFRAFKVDGLRFIYTTPGKKQYSRRDTLENFIKDKLLYPFLLFINGSLVPWSRIEVIKDYDYDYLLIYGLEKHEEVHFNIIEFPCNVRYGEDDDILPESERSVGLYFDEAGHLTMGDQIKYRLEVIDDSIYGELQLISEEKPYIEFHMEEGHTVKPTSIIVFRNGVVDPNGTDELRNKGWNIFHNPFPEEFASLKYAVFYSEKTSKSAAHWYTPCIDRDSNHETLIKNIRSGVSYLNKLFKLNDFDFKMDPEKSFKENMDNALTYIIGYNANLMDPVYKKETDVFIETYTGADMISRAARTGYMSISRKRRGHFDCYLTIFVNGYLYKYSERLAYRNNMIDIPVIGIKPEDKIEFVFDGGADNITDTIVIEENTPIYIGHNINDLRLFSSEKHDLTYDVFEVDPDGRTQFEIGFEYEVVGTNTYIITLEDPWYYGRVLTMASVNQRRYYRFDKNTRNPDTDGKYYFLLPTDFNFCHDKSHYLVLLNGRALSQNNFTVTVTKRTRPFDKLYLYITAELTEDDVLDVYYLPTVMVEALYMEDLKLSGDIVVDCSKLDVALSSDNYFVFVDGLKVHPSDIINISRNRMRIKTSYNSIHNVQLVKYNNSVEELEEVFKKTNSDEWSRYIDSLEPYNLNNLINNLTDLTSPVDTDNRDYYYDLSTIVSDIIFDYYMKRAGLTLMDNAFVYDFEEEAVKINENNGVIALNTTNSLLKDKLYQYWYNQTDADMEGVEWSPSPVDADNETLN